MASGQESTFHCETVISSLNNSALSEGNSTRNIKTAATTKNNVCMCVHSLNWLEKNHCIVKDDLELLILLGLVRMYCTTTCRC